MAERQPVVRPAKKWNAVQERLGLVIYGSRARLRWGKAHLMKSVECHSWTCPWGAGVTGGVVCISCSSTC